MKTIVYKKIIFHDIETIPVDYKYLSPSDLTNSELDDIVLLGIDECWYWYWAGNYEGSGQILMRKGELYDIDSLGHCSCYGPTEKLSFNGKKLEEIQMSEDLKKEVSPLIEIATKK